MFLTKKIGPAVEQRSHRERSPELARRYTTQTRKSRGRDANHLERVSAKQNFLSDDIPIALEPVLPRPVTEHDLWPASRRRGVLGEQRAAKRGAHTQHAKVLSSY